MIFLKKHINKIILIIIIFLLLLVFYSYLTREKEYIKTFNDMITIKVYTDKNPDKIFSLIEKEYNSDVIKKILIKNDVEKFIINNDGNITAGKHYNNKKYLVSIIKENKVEDIVMLENESMFVYEDEEILIAAINDTLKKAEDDITKYLSNKELSEKKKLYIIDENKKITKQFEVHIK